MGGANCSLCPGCPMGKGRPWPAIFNLVLLHTQHIIQIIILTLMCFDEYNIFIRQEVYTPSSCKHRLLTDCTDTSQGSCYKCNCRIRAIGKLMWYDTWTVTQKVLCDDQLYLHHKLCISHVSKQLTSMYASMCIGMTSKHCKWTPFEQNYMDIQSVLYMRLYSTSTTVTYGCGIIPKLMNMSVKTAQCQHLGWYHQGHCFGPKFPMWQANWPMVLFSGNYATWMLEGVPVCEIGVIFQSHCREDV
jgi:hypothetical protein